MRLLYHVAVFLILGSLLAYVCTEKLRNSRLVNAVTDAKSVLETQAAQAADVAAAQRYATPLVKTVQLLCQENSSLIGREQEAAKVVNGFQQESKLLKASLKEAVEMIQAQQTDNNTLIKANEVLQYKIDVLEAALKAIKEAQGGVTPVVPVPDIPVPDSGPICPPTTPSNTVIPTNPSKVV